MLMDDTLLRYLRCAPKISTPQMGIFGEFDVLWKLALECRVRSGQEMWGSVHGPSRGALPGPECPPKMPQVAGLKGRWVLKDT
jgi:hypothetical protein